MAELLADADVVRFDGSDMMLASVGTGTFLDAMALFVGTAKIESAQTVAQSGYPTDETG